MRQSRRHPCGPPSRQDRRALKVTNKSLDKSELSSHYVPKVQRRTPLSTSLEPALRVAHGRKDNACMAIAASGRRREQFLKLSVPILVVRCLKSLGFLMNFIRGIGGKLLVFGTFWKPWRKSLEAFGSVSSEMESGGACCVLLNCFPRPDVGVSWGARYERRRFHPNEIRASGTLHRKAEKLRRGACVSV
jgi:hypothetical protein